MQYIRKRTFEILDIGFSNDRVSQVIDILLIALISLNVLSVILETLPALKFKYQFFFSSFEIFSVSIFTIEYLARIWSCVENSQKKYTHVIWGRLRYMLTPMALIDLIVILPLYLSFFVTVDLRFMRVIRLLRVFRLTRYSASMSLLLQVVADEAKSIAAALFVLCMLIVMASSFIYLAEHKAQPDAFSSIPAAMWWAIITMTGVGYGDVIPLTVTGKILASIISIISIGIFALPAGLLASGFSEAIRQRRLHYRKLVTNVMEDGVITADEAQELKETRESLGLDSEDAENILKNSFNSASKDMCKSSSTKTCPHCGEALD